MFFNGLMSRVRVLVALGAVAFSINAWATDEAPLEVVASFSILGDMVKQVGGDAVSVSTIVGVGGDAHSFEPRPSDAKKLASAQLLFLNGLEFEAWLPRLVQAAGYKGKQLVLTNGITAIKYQEDTHEHHDDSEDDQHGEYDPHAWQSLDNAVIYVEHIRDALVSARPEASELINANAESYLAEIRTLNTSLKATFADLPVDRRKVISSHDAFAYLGAEYGLEFIALLGVSNQAEPSAKEIADIINRVKAEKITAIFVENVVSPKLVEQVARETGAKVGGVLYSDALAKSPHEADSYLGLIRWNTSKLLEALSP